MCVTPLERPRTGESSRETTEPATDDLAKGEEPDTAPAAVPAVASDDQQPAAGINKVQLGDPSLTAGIPSEWDLTIEQIQAWLDDEAKHVALESDQI